MATARRRIHFWLAGWAASALLRALHATWSVRVHYASGLSADAGEPDQIIVAFWHRHILTMLSHFPGRRVCVPVSESRDGEYVAQAMARFGFSSVRGSTSRGSLKLLRNMLRRIEQGWIPAITPDGPRGPRYSVQQGVSLLARRSGLPVCPFGVAVRDAWVLASWDAFVIPKPWTDICIVVGDPLRRGDFEDDTAFCKALRQALFAARDRARRRLDQAK